MNTCAASTSERPGATQQSNRARCLHERLLHPRAPAPALLLGIPGRLQLPALRSAESVCSAQGQHLQQHTVRAYM